MITPHPGEFARLTGRSIAEIEKHREEIAQEFAEGSFSGRRVEGPGTIVTDGDRLFRNTTGNSGMGTGDPEMSHRSRRVAVGPAIDRFRGDGIGCSCSWAGGRRGC